MRIIGERTRWNRGREKWRLVRKKRERKRMTERRERIERGAGRWRDLLASFLGTLSLTTIQFAFHPINRASRRAFPGTHGYVFSQEFFISLPHNGERCTNSPNMISVLPLITSILLPFTFSLSSFFSVMSRNDEIIFLFMGNYKGARQHARLR